MECHRTEAGYRLHFPALADFLVHDGASEVSCAHHSGTRPDTLRHLFLDQVFPLVLSLRGDGVLHASVINTPAGACAFAGQSGSGKSTLAATFLEQGFSLISDDCLLLREHQGKFFAFPSYPGLRLWEDSVSHIGRRGDRVLPVAQYTSKRRLLRHPFSGEPKPLAAIYLLARSSNGNQVSDPEISKLSPRDAMTALLKYSFVIDPGERSMLIRQFNFLRRLATLVPVSNLLIPDDFSALPEVHRAILASLEILHPGDNR